MFDRTDLRLDLYCGSRAYFASAAAFEQNAEGGRTVIATDH